MVKYKNLILLCAVFLIIILPLLLVDSDFSGADGIALEAIKETNQEYKPWFTSFWQPPGGETESLLFALQAAFGAGFLGYYIGYKKGQKKVRDR